MSLLGASSDDPVFPYHAESCAAVYQNKWPDYLIRGITFFGVSIPSFWIGLILLSIFGVQLRWINVAGGTH